MPVPAPRKCVKCREREVYLTTLPSHVEEMEHDGRKYAVSLQNFEVWQCRNCSETALDDSATQRLTDALRSAAGLLTPVEIRRNREALGFTQQQLADYLRISMFTLSRWETGAQIQQRTMDALLRVFFQSTEARNILGVPGQAFTLTYSVPVTFTSVNILTDSSAFSLPNSDSSPFLWYSSIESPITLTGVSGQIDWQRISAASAVNLPDEWYWPSPSPRKIIWSSEKPKIEGPVLPSEKSEKPRIEGPVLPSEKIEASREMRDKAPTNLKVERGVAA